MNSKLFEKFSKDRNIKKSTKKGYESALKQYINFHGENIEYLIKEAQNEEDKKILLKNRQIKKRLVDFRSYLLNSNYSHNTVKTFYLHFEIELPNFPNVKYEKDYQRNYLDLPTKKDIKSALDISTVDLRSIILFMSSSGTAKAETLNLTVKDFITATAKYHNGGSLDEILDKLSKTDNIVPTFYLKRIKTDKYYYTFCSPEASREIVKYLKTRKKLTKKDKLFDFTDSKLFNRFQEINDTLKWGFKGKYRFFTSHTLRKFHASNIGLSSDHIDALQGRQKSKIHEIYIKTNPKKLKKIYESAMDNLKIQDYEKNEVNQEFNITINIFLSGKEYNIY